MSKINIFCEYVKFGAISLKKMIFLSITELKFESNNPFAHNFDTYKCDKLPHTTLRLYSIDLQLFTDSS